MEEELKELKEIVFRIINRTAKDYDDALFISGQIQEAVMRACGEARQNVLQDDLYD